MLTAYAESDFKTGATQGSSHGVFQQTAPWWATALAGPVEQCLAFLADFTAQAKAGRHTGDPVHDCWVTQRWSVPNNGVTWPDPGPGFLTAPETVNYTRRVPLIPKIITERHLP